MLTELAAAGYQRAFFSGKKKAVPFVCASESTSRSSEMGPDTEWVTVHDLRKNNPDTPEVKERIDNLTDPGAAFEVGSTPSLKPFHADPWINPAELYIHA
ncbi:hypothetical protein QEV70_07315 [Trueperella pyogenes]|uniref:hypothetical protein n=1 Tax=Trueperella pyogenes TaxID=1661 RepID=UPI00324CD78C